MNVAERQYNDKCAPFKARLSEFEALYSGSGPALIITDEFKPVGMAQHWSKRSFAIWAGMALSRRVFIVHCLANPPVNSRIVSCNRPFFNFDRYFTLPGGTNLSWVANTIPTAVPYIPSDGFAYNASVRHREAPVILMRGFNGFVLRDALNGLTVPDMHSSQYKCTNYAVSRPAPQILRMIQPFVVSKGPIISVHIRTARADNRVCFPDDTPPIRQSIDNTFGNHKCTKFAFDYWRFKLLSNPSRGCSGKERHVADVFPLSRWLSCTVNRSTQSGGIAFLSTDAPALQRYVNTAYDKQLSTLSVGTVGHTHLQATSSSHVDFESHFERAVADWYIMTLSTEVLVPVPSTFSASACIPFTVHCHIRFIRPSRACSTGCFEHCEASCRWSSAYMGKRVHKRAS